VVGLEHVPGADTMVAPIKPEPSHPPLLPSNLPAIGGSMAVLQRQNGSI